MHADLLFIIAEINTLPRAYRELGRRLPMSFRVNAGLIIVSVVAQALCAFGLLPFGSYLVGLSVLLYAAAFGFVRLFVSLRPALSGTGR